MSYLFDLVEEVGHALVYGVLVTLFDLGLSEGDERFLKHGGRTDYDEGDCVGWVVEYEVG